MVQRSGQEQLTKKYKKTQFISWICIPEHVFAIKYELSMRNATVPELHAF